VVRQCIEGAMLRWESPATSDGDVTIVSYPFVVRAAAGDGWLAAAPLALQGGS
jgi:hypothetical protein